MKVSLPASGMAILGFGLVLLPCLGCVILDPWTGTSSTPPPAPVHQVTATWENRVMVTNDTVNQGQPLPGLAGRLYLFGADLGHPVAGDGKVVVDMFDPAHAGPDGKALMLERWELDKDSLKRLLRKDIIGWGYTLFLPLTNHRPELSRVQLQVCYMPEKGTPLYAPASTVTIRQEGPPPQVRETVQKLPVSR